MGTYLDRRRLSALEFYKQAVEIRHYVTQMVMNEKIVPKRWRFIHAIPITNLLHKWFNDMITANNIPMNTQERVATRVKYQDLAISDCECLLEELAYLAETQGVTKVADKVEHATYMILDAIKLLNGWRRATKLQA